MKNDDVLKNFSELQNADVTDCHIPFYWWLNAHFKYTVSTPIKDAASIQKMFFQPCTMMQNFVYICYTQLHKILQNAPIFGIFQSAAID